MSTTQNTTSSNMYNPASMNTFNAFQQPYGQAINQMMQNPLGFVSPMFNLSGQMAQQNAAQQGATQMGNLFNNLNASGFSGVNLPAFMQSQIAAQGRATSANQSNAFLQNQLAKNQAALGVQQFGASQAGGYRPLQTGNTQIQQQGGMGTWLPQIAGMGLSAAMGMPGLFGGGGGNAGPFNANTNYGSYGQNSLLGTGTFDTGPMPSFSAYTPTAGYYPSAGSPGYVSPNSFGSGWQNPWG